MWRARPEGRDSERRVTMAATQLPHFPSPRLQLPTPPHHLTLAPKSKRRTKKATRRSSLPHQPIAPLAPSLLSPLLGSASSASSSLPRCCVAAAAAFLVVPWQPVASSDGPAGSGVVPGARPGGAAPVVVLGAVAGAAAAGARAAAGGRRGRADHHAGRVQAGLHLPRLRVSGALLDRALCHAMALPAALQLDVLRLPSPLCRAGTSTTTGPRLRSWPTTTSAPVRMSSSRVLCLFFFFFLSLFI